MAMWVLESLARTDPTCLPAVVEALEPALESQNVSSARTLGKLQQEVALPYLRAQRDSTNDFELAYLAWQMDGRTNDLWAAADRALQAGVMWQFLACRTIRKLADTEPVPDAIQQHMQKIVSRPVDRYNDQSHDFMWTTTAKDARSILELCGAKSGLAADKNCL